MVPPGTLHVIRWETQAELLVEHVEECFWRRLEEPISTSTIAVEANVGASRDVPLWQLVSTLLDLWKESGPASERGAKMVAEALISREIQLLSQIPVASRKNVGSLSPNRLRLIDEYVDKHLRYEIHVPDLAKLVGFSVAHLTTVLKNTIGLAPYEYITRCRMHKARLLLLTGEYRLREVANAVGYNDPEHFSWKFKNFFNYPPRFLLRYGHG